MKLDSNDLKLIELLKKDARASVTSLAESAGIARVTTHDRMVRLKREGLFADIRWTSTQRRGAMN